MTSKIPESCSRKEIQSFLTELGNLLKKHGVEIYAEADALDDSGLESWLEFTKVIKKQGKHPKEHTIATIRGGETKISPVD